MGRIDGQLSLAQNTQHILNSNHEAIYKDIIISTETHEILDIKSSVMKENTHSKSELYLRHYSHSFDWREKKSTDKSGINLNNHICQGL